MVKKKPKKKRKDDETLAFLRQLTIIAGLMALAVIVGIVIFVTSYQDTASDEIILSIELPEEAVTRSVPFEVDVNINNNTNTFLSDVSLSLSMEEGLVGLEYGSGGTTVNDPIGEVEEKSIAKRSYQILPVAQTGSRMTITGTLTYKIGGTNFEKEVSEEVEVGDEAISVMIDKPDQILAGSVFDVTVNYENKTDFSFPDLRLEMKYPDNFTYVSSDLAPDSFTNYWKLGTLKANSEGSLTIKGRLTGGGTSPDFEARMFAVFLETSYAAAETESELKTSKSPIHLTTTVKGSRNYVSRAGDSLQYAIDYKNESGVALKNVEIRSKMTGELFDYTTLVSEGKLNTLTNTLTWDSATNPELEVLEPGESGTVRINVGVKSSFPINRLNDKDFTLRVNTEIESPSVPYYLSADKTSAGDVLTTKVQGLTTIDAQAFYRDANSGIANSGPIPPKVGEATQYTIHWIIRNYSTDVEDVTVSAELPQGVTWTGVMKSNTDSVPLYDEGTRVMSWEIDEIAATKGVLSAPVEAIFQVEAIPNEGLVGQFQPLLSNTTLEAKDGFTGMTLNYSDLFLNTSLSDDQTVNISQGLVGR